MSEALINPAMIRWARERAGFNQETLAEKVATKIERLIAWESGDRLPTFSQARRLADLLLRCMTKDGVCCV